MEFWTLAYNRKWVTIVQLRQAVKTESNLYGQITSEEYQIITGEDYVA